MIEDDIEIDIEENDIEIEIESENLEILSKDELLKPLLEVCLTNQSEEFCKCTTETISENSILNAFFLKQFQKNTKYIFSDIISGKEVTMLDSLYFLLNSF